MIYGGKKKFVEERILLIDITEDGNIQKKKNCNFQMFNDRRKADVC